MKTLATLKSIGVPILFCGVALPFAVHFNTPFAAFLLGAMASALYGDRKARGATIVLLAFCFDFFFLPPAYKLVFGGGSLIRFAGLVGAMFLATELIVAKIRSNDKRVRLERDFSLLAETCADCILISDSEQIVRFANPALTGLFGYSLEDIVGRPLSFLLPLKSGQSPSGEFQVKTKTGNLLAVEARYERCDGKTTVSLRNISERESAQEKIEQRGQEFELILDSIPGMVYSRSTDGRVEYVNKAVTDYFGTTVEAVKDGAWIDSLHPDEKHSVLALLQKKVDEGKPYTIEYRRKRFDGQFRWFQTSVQPLEAADGKVIRWYGILIDIHDRKTAEESLRHVQRRLASATQLATAAELSASIVHEVCQPLAAIVANGQSGLRWLTSNPPNMPRGIASIERIVRDGKDAGEMVRGLRTLFKKASPQKSSLDLRQVLDEVILLTRGRLERNETSLIVKIPADLPPVRADRIQVQQVLLNLVSNALEGMCSVLGQARVLTIQLEKQDSVVATEVADTGVGVPDLDQIFETFFTTKETGMGMGLSICRSIIEAHDGRLSASRNEPQGIRMSFTLPLFTVTWPEETRDLAGLIRKS